MFKKGFFLIAAILLTIFSCVQEKKIDLTISKEFADSLLNMEKICIYKKERIISYQDTIRYSGEKNQIIIEKDTITYISDSKGKRIIRLINNEPLKKYTMKNSEFNIDSMELVIDLNELNICYLKNNSNIIIIASKPMNWVGRMTRFSFFQLINSKEKTVFEFIREEE